MESGRTLQAWSAYSLIVALTIGVQNSSGNFKTSENAGLNLSSYGNGGNDGGIGGSAVDENIDNRLVCPNGYIKVAPFAPYADKQFCIMKYEAKLEYDGAIIADGNFDTTDGLADSFEAAYSNVSERARYKAVSVPQGRPWVHIKRGQTPNNPNDHGAVEACRQLGPDYDLMTNDQWQAVVRNVENVPANWLKDSNGDTVLNHGHSDADPAQTCDASHEFVEKDCLGNVQEDDPTEKRTNVLSNGEVIWDLGGNVNEWVKDDNNSLAHGKAGLWEPFTKLDYGSYPEIQAKYGPANLHCGNPMGKRHCGFGFLWDGNAGAILRGSYWVYGANAGMFTTVLFFGPSNYYKGSGFRCVYRPSGFR